LSLAQIHAALTYYYENKVALDGQIQKGIADAPPPRRRFPTLNSGAGSLP
jgi:hypothetical protein